MLVGLRGGAAAAAAISADESTNTNIWSMPIVSEFLSPPICIWSFSLERTGFSNAGCQNLLIGLQVHCDFVVVCRPHNGSKLFIKVEISGCGSGYEPRSATKRKVLDRPLNKNHNAALELDYVRDLFANEDSATMAEYRPQ